MREQVEKLRAVEKDLSKEHGDFELFALFLRENAPNKWDLIVSSDWARADKKAAIHTIVGKLQSALNQRERIMLSRVIILNKDNEGLSELHNMLSVEHGLAEISDGNFFGLAIKHAYFITLKRG